MVQQTVTEISAETAEERLFQYALEKIKLLEVPQSPRQVRLTAPLRFGPVRDRVVLQKSCSGWAREGV